MKRLNSALEAQDEVPEVDPVEAPPVDEEADFQEVTEADVVTIAAQDDEVNNDIEDTSVALEALSMYASNLEYLIATKTYAQETLDVIQFGIRQQTARLHVAEPTIGLESETTLEQRHEMALEGLRDIWSRVAQSYDLMNRQGIDLRAEFWSSSSSILAHHRAELAKITDQHATEKEHWLDAQHSGSLVKIWQHYSTEHGQVTDIVAATGKDLELSKYILTKYSVDILNLYTKLLGVVRGGKITDIRSAVTFAKRIELLPHPADLFDKRFLVGGRPYLGVTGLQAMQGSARNPITIGDTALTKLAELATARAWEENWSAVHGLKKFTDTAAGSIIAHRAGTKTEDKILKAGRLTVGRIVGSTAAAIVVSSAVSTAAGAVVGKTIQMTSQEIAQILKDSALYLDHVETYLDVTKKVNQAASDLKTATKQLFAGLPDDIPKEQANQIQQLLKQIEQYFANVHTCFGKPGFSETNRAFKGSKFSRYIATRMIATAK